MPMPYDDYQQGKFARARVPEWPPELIEQWQHITGKPWSHQAMVEYERIRAFFRYEGVEGNRLAPVTGVAADPFDLGD